MACIWRKKKNGVVVGIGIKQKIDGKWEYGKSLGRDNAAEQLAKIKLAELQIMEGRGDDQDGIPFGELCHRYQGTRVNMSKRNLAKWESRFNSAVLPLLGDIPSHLLDHEKLYWYMRQRKAMGVSDATVHNELTDIMTVLNWATVRTYPPILRDNPARFFRKGSRADAIIGPPTDAEVDAILSHARPHLFRTIVLALHTGCRPGPSELFALEWGDVDFASNKIAVTSANKGGITHRDIPLSTSLREYLLRWREEDLAVGATFIIHYQGHPVETVRHSWAAAKKLAGVKRRLRLYECRHYFATRLLEGGADMKAVSTMMGHVDQTMIMKRYQHVSGPLQRTAIDMLPEIGRSNTGNTSNSGEKVVSIKKEQKRAVAR